MPHLKKQYPLQWYDELATVYLLMIWTLPHPTWWTSPHPAYTLVLPQVSAVLHERYSLCQPCLRQAHTGERCGFIATLYQELHFQYLSLSDHIINQVRSMKVSWKTELDSGLPTLLAHLVRHYEEQISRYVT